MEARHHLQEIGINPTPPSFKINLYVEIDIYILSYHSKEYLIIVIVIVNLVIVIPRNGSTAKPTEICIPPLFFKIYYYLPEDLSTSLTILIIAVDFSSGNNLRPAVA